MKLGRYEVVRELGKGAMGIVYLAKDPLIGRLVALKTIRASAHSDDDEAKEFQQRFVREAQAAGILNHPAIVTVHDIGQDEATGMSFIAMEYVEGHNLKEVLAQGRPLNFDQIGDVISQVADALDFAHSKGIIHRDVKPANIILVEGMRAKITDFGIAKIASGGANLTTTGQFLGTPNYMAPEQIKGSPVDGRTDIFSLGICLYELLTRRKPFGGDSLTSISYKIVHEPFAPLREINPQIPEGYEEVVAKCLAKDPGKRFQRGRDLMNALRAVLRGEKPVVAEPLIEDETMVTRDFVPPPPPDSARATDRVPTIEIPFPQAIEAEGTPTKPRAVATSASETPEAPEAKREEKVTTQPARPPKAPRLPVRQQIRKTLTDVRAYPLWKMPIAPPIFIGISAALVIALLAAMLVIRSSVGAQPSIDKRAEAQHEAERVLRHQANELWRQGSVNAAYAKLSELRRLAPNSPYVNAELRRLEIIRHQEDIGKQQTAVAQQKLQQGIDLYNQKKYAEAVPVLQEAFSMNPNSNDAASYLKLAQQQIEQNKQTSLTKLGSAATTTQPKTKVAQGSQTKTATGGDGPSASNLPSQVTTYFNSPFNEGFILVKAGTQVLAHENLWQETGRLFRRKQPRVVSVTKEIMPTNTDIEVWVIVPSLKVNEYKVIPHKFTPGGFTKLVVSFNPQSRTFDYQVN